MERVNRQGKSLLKLAAKVTRTHFRVGVVWLSGRRLKISRGPTTKVQAFGFASLKH